METIKEKAHKIAQETIESNAENGYTIRVTSDGKTRVRLLHELIAEREESSYINGAAEMGNRLLDALREKEYNEEYVEMIREWLIEILG